MFPGLDLSYAEDTKANVTVLDLKDFYEKGQSRRKANSEQRLLNADVHLKATAQKQIQVTIMHYKSYGHEQKKNETKQTKKKLTCRARGTRMFLLQCQKEKYS